MVRSSSPVLAKDNRFVSSNGEDSKNSSGKEVLNATHHGGVNSSGEASYLLALLKPVSGDSVSLQKNGQGHHRKVNIVPERRLTKGASMVESRWNNNDSGVVGWSSEVLQSLGEAEGALWHIRSELISWKENCDSLLKKVDGGLGLLMGLGHVSVDPKVYKKELGRQSGPKDEGNKKGLVRGPVSRSVHEGPRFLVGSRVLLARLVWWRLSPSVRGLCRAHHLHIIGQWRPASYMGISWRWISRRRQSSTKI